MTETGIAMSISTLLIEEVRLSCIKCLEDLKSGNFAVDGDNSVSFHAMSAYVLAVCALEAVMGELLSISYDTSHILIEFPLSKDDLEKLDLRQKYLLIPHLLWGKTFVRGEEPFQSFDALVKVRNDLVHYKMKAYGAGNDPKYWKLLEAKNIPLNIPSTTERGTPVIQGISTKVLTKNGAFWAHNTACDMVQKLLEFADDKGRLLMRHVVLGFKVIPENASIDQI